MAKLLNNDVFGLVGTASSQWVNEISDGSLNHAVAVKNGITFFNGKDDNTGVKWDGVQEFEVIIPTLADIVSNPVTFKGVINSASDIPGTPSGGDLYYIGTNGTYFNQVCEAGDMAIYDGDNHWYVISGENQTYIYSVDSATGVATFTLSDTAVSVLNVEGKDLKLAVNYADILGKVKVTKNTAANISVLNGTVTVPSIHVGLHKESDGSLDISKSVNIDLPTALASGDVTISNKVFASTDFSWDAGTLPSISLNSAAISVTASTGLTLDVNTSVSDYVSDVVAIKGAQIAAATSASYELAYVSSLTSGDSSTSYVTGIHAAEANETVDFTIPAIPSIGSGNTFVSGLSTTESDTGDVVSSISVGAVSVNTTGTDFLRGTMSGTTTFVSSVTFGNAIQDTSASWFYSGLGDGSDVVTDVTVGAVSLIAGGANASFTGNAVISASVSDHVLSFNTGSFMTPVALSKAADTIAKKGFSKTGVKLDGFAQTADTFTKGGLTQDATSISYKSLLTKDLAFSAGTAASFAFDKGTVKEYSANLSYAKITTTDATVTKSGYKLGNTAITATIPANTVAVGMSVGTLPSWSVGTATGTLTGSVGTALTTTSVDWLGIDADKLSDVLIPGAYSLTSASADAGVDVAAASTYALDSATVTIAADQYVTEVYPDGTNAAGIKSA